MSDVGSNERLAAGRGSWLEWPRLYLDTGLLLEIADGLIEGPILTRLLTTMADLPAVLVVSKDHMQDAIPRGHDENRDHFAAAVQRFPFRAVVVREPREIEPWTEASQDIGLCLIEDFLELVTRPEARPHLAQLSAAQDKIHTATSVSQVVRRMDPLSPKASELAFACMVTLARGWMGTDISEILAMWEESKGRLADGERASIVVALTLWAELVREHILTDEDREKFARDFLDTFDDTSRIHSPGMFLARRLTGCWQRDTARNPKRGDSVDVMHASYFPYVNIATCDRSAFACLAKYIGLVKGPRSPRVFRNNDLESVVAALASFGGGAPSSGPSA
jgi:hypothetical protein